MKKSILLFNIMVFLLGLTAIGQKPVIELKFTGVNNEQWIPIENIVIKNITRGVDTTIYYPDTTLMLHYQVGLHEFDQQPNRFRVFQNYPNPVHDQTTITIYVPEKNDVTIVINDAIGREIISKEMVLDQGHHSFKFIPGSDHLYFVTAISNESSSGIKIINSATNYNHSASLEYIQNKNTGSLYKSTTDIQDFSFDTGDDLIFIANANNLKSGIFDEPKTDMSYIFEFASNIPCPGDSAITFEGQIYHSIQIFNQCWLVENLNVGTMIPGTQDMEDNNTIEKYCFGDNEDNCDEYGGLYQWDELMEYTITSGTEGICPPGWYIPTNNDWVILSGAVDSQYSFGESIWYDAGYNGFDAGLNLKSENGWTDTGNGTDAFGFTALPAGQRISNGYFDGLGYKANFWSSTEELSNIIWYRALFYIDDGIDRNTQTNTWGKSVRCIKD